MDNKIIVLVRVSTSPQDIESQTNELRKKSRELGYDDSHQILIETIESGIKLSEEERLGIQRMKYYIETDSSIDCVICWEPSRLSRRQKDLYSIRDYLAYNKIQLYIQTPEIKLLTDDRTNIDPSSNVVFSLFASLSENEMMLKKERFIRAKKRMKERGQKFGGSTIFGYIKNKEKKCVPHPIHSQIIIELFNHYVNTDSSLYDTYKFATGHWPDLFPVQEYKKSQRKIKHFFDTEVYVNGNWCYPPLIDKKTWDKTQEKKLKGKCSARYNCKREFLCRGKIYCGHCGRMMTGCGGKTNGYVCSTDKLHSLQINQEVADWIMWEETKSVVNLNNYFDDTIESINENQEVLNSKIEIKKQYEDKIRTFKEQSEKLLDLYLNDNNNNIDIDRYNKKHNEINENIRVYSQKIDNINVEISSYQTIINDTKEKRLIKPINISKINDFRTKMEFVRKYIKKMIVTRGEDPHTTYITFTYTRPMIIARCEYLYIHLNQNLLVYRINEDETKDLIYENDCRYKKNKITGKFEK